MKTITFKGKKYDVPTSWDDVTLEQQIKVSKDAELFKSDVTKKIAIISGYIGIEVSELKRTNINELGPLFKELGFINEEIETKKIIEFEHNGNTYYTGQNIMEQQFQDYVSLENALQGTQGDVLSALPYIIAILAKKKKDTGQLETLDDYDVEARAEEFKKLPITVAQNVGFFLSSSVSIYKATSQLYSNPAKLIQIKAEEVLGILNKQVGQGLLMRLQIGLLKNYVKYIRRNAHKYFTSTRAKSLRARWKRTFKNLMSKK